MTTREMMAFIGQSPGLWALVLCVPALSAIALGAVHPRGAGERAPFKYGYSLAVYVACIPGVFALMVDAYTLFFTRENLLDTNFLMTVAPVLSMVVTLGLVRRNVEFGALPGFERLSGLVLMLAVTFASVIYMSKLKVVLLFHGSFWNLVMMGVAIFLALKYGAYLAFRRKRPRYD